LFRRDRAAPNAFAFETDGLDGSVRAGADGWVRTLGTSTT
jgi:hypothetical protein